MGPVVRSNLIYIRLMVPICFRVHTRALINWIYRNMAAKKNCEKKC